jgi:hypothetical protein
MATKPKAGVSKKKTPSAADKKVQKTQRERFMETARELEADETGEDFDIAIKKVLSAKLTSKR